MTQVTDLEASSAYRYDSNFNDCMNHCYDIFNQGLTGLLD